MKLDFQSNPARDLNFAFNSIRLGFARISADDEFRSNLLLRDRTSTKNYQIKVDNGNLVLAESDGSNAVILGGIGSTIGITGFVANGDATGTYSAGTIPLNLSSTGVSPGAYTKVTVDVKGRVIGGSSLTSSDVTAALGYTPSSSERGVYYPESYGAIGNGIADDSAAIQSAINAAAANGGGIVRFDAKTYVATMKAKKNVTLSGKRYGTKILPPASATTGAIESEYFWESVNFRLQTTLAAGANVIVVPTARPPTSIGHGLLIQLDNFSYHYAVVGGISGNNITISPALPSAASTNNQIFNISAPGPENIKIENIWIDGVNQAPLNNLCQSQSVANAATFVKNGALYNGGSTAIFSHTANLYLVVTCAGDETGKSITINGTRRNGDGTTSSQSETLSLGRAGQFVSNKWYETVSNIVMNGNSTSTIQIGVADGPTGRNAISIWGASFQLDNVYVDNIRGWGLRNKWINTGAGFNSDYKMQQGHIGRLDLYRCDGGGWWGDGPVDSAASAIYVNYPLGDGIYLARNQAGTPINSGHINGGGVGGSVIREPNNGIRMECESSAIGSGFKIEGCRGPRVRMLGNNCRISDADMFHINNSESFAAVKIGDAANGWFNVAGYRIFGQSRWCDYPIDFDSDGGWGVIDLSGYGTVANLASTAASSATELNITNAGVARDGFANGNQITIVLDNGDRHYTNVDEIYFKSSASPTISVGDAITIGNYYGFSIITTTGTTASSLATQINAANIPYVTATVISGVLYIRQTFGGGLNITGTSALMTALGFTPGPASLVKISTGLPSTASSGQSVFRGKRYIGTPYSGPTGSRINIAIEQTDEIYFVQDNGAAGRRKSYKPTITSGSGSITSYTATGSYSVFTKEVKFAAEISITNNGSGAGYIDVTLPVVAFRNAVAQGWENNASGKSLQVRIFAGTNIARIYLYDYTYPAVTGAYLIVSGSYEAS